jgi:type II secretory pathway pseudopilin PulG
MKPLIKTILVLIAILAAVAFTVAQPAPDQSIKQTAFYQQVMDSLQVAGLGSSWLTNTNPPLTYDTSTFTVQGWTNTNAIAFTNPIAATALLLQAAGEDDVKLENGSGAFEFVTSVGSVATLAPLSTSLRGFLAFEGTNAVANKATTRSNLFGAPGLTATITNGGLVFVFTNGILASTNAP